jgi:hypothetical protein
MEERNEEKPALTFATSDDITLGVGPYAGREDA